VTDPRKTTRRTLAIRRDFLSRLDSLRIRVRFRVECIKQGRRFAESVDQLQWALQELDRIQNRYVSKLPWPAGGMEWAVRQWSGESDLRNEFLHLEKEYYRQVNKTP